VAIDSRAPATPETTGRFVLPVLCAASALSVTNALALSPFLADIGRDFGVSVALLGQTLTASGLLGAMIGLFIGPLAERAGYHRVLLAGTFALLISNLLTASATGLGMLLLAQLANGVAGATVSPMAFAYAGVIYRDHGRGRAISRIYATAAGSEVVILPLLALVGDAFGWRWSFAVLALGTVGFFIAALVLLPRRASDTEARLHPRAIVAAYLPMLHDRPLTLLFAAQFLRGVCWTGMLSYIGAFINDEMGYSLRLSGLVWAVLGPGFLIGSLLVGGRLRLADRRKTFMVSVAVLAAMVALTFQVEAGILITFGLLLVAAAGGGAAEVVNATAISATSPVPQGPTMSLHSSTLRFGTASGAMVGGALLAIGGYGLLGIGLALVGCGAIACAWRSGQYRAAAPRIVAAPSAD